MAYLLDTNVFIDAKNRYYGMEICPGFWDWLRYAHGSAQVFSIEEVKQEIIAGDDELKPWVNLLQETFFLKRQESDKNSLAMVSKWVSEQPYEQSAISEFFTKADYFLCALAHARRCTVVTGEKSGNSKKRVKIPDVCKNFNIPCINTFELLQKEGAVFEFNQSASEKIQDI